MQYQLAISQNPLVKQWDYRFGGTTSEKLWSFQQTTDGGYLIGGYSHSGIGGNKTCDTWGGDDYWIVKTDSLGNKLWDKCYGGTDDDWLQSCQQTADGGYILGGWSQSVIGGDKTQATWGFRDYWVVKIDSLGNKQWDKDFGGTNYDYLFSLQQTTDGGYILGGYSQSQTGGDKTQDTWFNSIDYWIIKIDSFGNKQWDKDFGGGGHDYFFSIQQTADGGYIFGGFSNSNNTGDKTQDNWDTTYQTNDYWIIKTDSAGTKQWDKVFGGKRDEYVPSVKQCSDGGYIIAGYSYSGISGDKTQSNWGPSTTSDYWIVKTNPAGIKQWDKRFGGTDKEELSQILQTLDGGYLISGDSYSPISGNKTENNMGLEQTWVIKTDSLGNLQWDKTMLTNGHDEQGMAISTKDSCYIMANITDAGIGGHKTQPSWGGYDYWIIKFCDSTLTTGSPTPALSGGEGVAIAPNPASDQIAITSRETINKIEVTDLLGNKILNREPLTSYLLLPTSFLPNGLYIVKAYTEKRVFQQKLVINHTR